MFGLFCSGRLFCSLGLFFFIFESVLCLTLASFVFSVFGVFSGISSFTWATSTLSFLAVVTFANPHVYLDTVVLIGSVSQQFSDDAKLAYVLGASIASFVFFFSLSYGAKLLAPIMKRPSTWRILDGSIALLMFIIAVKLAYTGNWL